MMQDIFANEDIVASLKKTYASMAKKQEQRMEYQQKQMEQEYKEKYEQQFKKQYEKQEQQYKQQYEQQIKEKDDRIDALTKENARLQMELEKSKETGDN